MQCSTAKFIVDAEMCDIGYRMAEGIRWDDFDAAIAAVPDIRPGGYYLGYPHTLEHFQTGFFMPEMFDNNSIEQWQAEGGIGINERALMKACAMLNEYEEPKTGRRRERSPALQHCTPRTGNSCDGRAQSGPLS